MVTESIKKYTDAPMCNNEGKWLPAIVVATCPFYMLLLGIYYFCLNELTKDCSYV